MDSNSPVQKAFFQISEKVARQIAVLNANLKPVEQ
jgi:hypothetical protein